MITNENNKMIIKSPTLANIPQELKPYKQWVAWKADQKGHGKNTKIPINPNTGRYASTNKPETWGTYEQAVAFYNSHKDEGITGIGFVFTMGDPFCGVDLDDCFDPEAEKMDGWASDILKDLNSYCEISPSNKGIKIFVKGKLPDKNRNTGNIEMYDKGQYFTVTGDQLAPYSKQIEDRSDEIIQLYENLLEQSQEQKTITTPIVTESWNRDIDSLKVSDETKVLIKQGEKKGLRSEPIMTCIIALLGSGLPAADIFYIFDNYPIGEKYRGQGFGKVSWLKGEIERARDFVKKNHRGGIKLSETTIGEKIDEKALALRAKDILDSKEPCGSFDTSRLPKILNDYIQCICKTTEAEPMIVTQSVLCTLSALMKKKCCIPEGQYFQMLYPNLWTLTIAPSGDFKTTALNKGASLAWKLEKEVSKKIREYEDADSVDNEKQQIKIRQESAILPNRTTSEGLLTSLSDGCSGMIICSEFGEWLENLSRSHNIGLKPLLTDLYDVPPQYSYKRSKRGNLIVKKPFITINGVSTMSWVNQNLKASDVSSGFFARFLLFYPPHKKIIPPALPQHVLQDFSTEDEIKTILDNIPQDSYWVISDTAKLLFNSIHNSLYNEMDKQDLQTKEFLSPYLKRWSPYILKIAMILQPYINSTSNEIGQKAIEGAYSIVEYAIKSTIFLFENELGETKQQTKQRKVIEYMAKKGGKVKRSTLQKSKTLGGGTKDYDYILDTLETSGEIIVDRTSKNKGDWIYILTT